MLLGSNTIAGFVAALPPFILGGLKVASGMLPALGIAILMQLIFDKTNAAYLFVGFVLTALLGMSTVGVAIVGATIAYVVYQQAMQRKRDMASLAVNTMSDDLGGEL